MTNAPASSPQDAADVLRHVASVRRQTQTLLQGFWFPLILFGTITLASAVVEWFWPGPAIGAFWLVAGPAGAVVVGRHYRDREQRIGLGRAPGPYIATSVGILVGAFTLPLLTHGDVQDVVSVFAVAAGYFVFAWLERSATVLGVALFLAAVPVVVLATGAAHPGAVTAAATGAALLVSGLLSRPAA